MIFLKRRLPSAGLLSLCLGGGFAVLSFLGAINILPLGLPAWPFSVPYGLLLSLFGFVVGLAIDLKKKPRSQVARRAIKSQNRPGTANLPKDQSIP
jgi:SSS family solute:Na+ symporter